MAAANSRLRPALLEYLARRFPSSEVTVLAGDASTRRFYRVVEPQGTPRIVMDYGAPFDGETDDVALERVFRAAGLPVAEIVEAAPTSGCLVLEDLGDDLLEQEIARRDPSERFELLARAVDLAAEIRRRGTPALAASDRALGPALDSERFRFEMDFFLEHYAVGLRGADLGAGHLRRALHELADVAAATPERVLCHRDFHSRNLLVRPDGALAMVDIQDARWGPDTYDLASLLRDAYLEVDEAWIGPLLRRYAEQLGLTLAGSSLEDRFDRVSAQRMIKALGTFGYQIKVRGQSRYESAIPRTADRLNLLLPRVGATRPLHTRLTDSGLL